MSDKMKPSYGEIDYTKKFACVNRELEARRLQSNKNEKRAEPTEPFRGTPVKIMKVQDGSKRNHNQKEGENNIFFPPSPEENEKEILPYRKRWSNLKISEGEGKEGFVDKIMEDTNKFACVSKETGVPVPDQRVEVDKRVELNESSSGEILPKGVALRCKSCNNGGFKFCPYCGGQLSVIDL